MPKPGMCTDNAAMIGARPGAMPGDFRADGRIGARPSMKLMI
jgi:tRNA A37 threonylcarbamoyltransferase TsaD